MKCDFHIHTNCSDGVLPPEKIVELAKEKGLDCIAITDHDTMTGVQRAIAHAKEVGIKCIAGMELSTIADGGQDVHMLVFNADTTLPGFDKEMEVIVGFRTERNRLLQQKLYEHGFDIDLSTLKTDGTVGRGEIGREMVKRGYCQTSAEAFDKYLGEGKCCYVKTRRLTPLEAVQFAKRFNGISVLAHPKNLRMTHQDFEKFLSPLVEAGLNGIEAQYFAHNISERKFFGKMAKKYKLIVTGGSDFHDYSHGLPLGQQHFSPNGFTKNMLGL